MNVTYQRIVEWVIPVLIGWGVVSLSDISKEIGKINQSLAVVVSTIDNHEQRLTKQGERIQSLELNEASHLKRK